MDESGEQFVAYFLPTDDTLTKRRDDFTNEVPYQDDEDYEYKMAREYNWNVKSKASKGYEENYFFVARGDGLYYNELETRVRLSKRRQKAGQTPSNTRLVVKHRPMNNTEYRMQLYREKQLQPVGEDDDEEENEEEMELDQNQDEAGEENENEEDKTRGAEDSQVESEHEKQDESENESKLFLVLLGILNLYFVFFYQKATAVMLQERHQDQIARHAVLHGLNRDRGRAHIQLRDPINRDLHLGRYRVRVVSLGLLVDQNLEVNHRLSHDHARVHVLSRAQNRGQDRDRILNQTRTQIIRKVDQVQVQIAIRLKFDLPKYSIN